jgi:2'-5' RNA ligase
MPSDGEFQRVYRFGTFVIWPPADLRAVVNQLRQRYDPASQAVCDAHITLTQPFLAEPSEQDWAAIERVADAHPPLTIEYGPLGTFLPYPCVYLDIKRAESLRALQRALYDLGIFNRSLPFSDPDQYVFHMSITDGYPDEEQTRQILVALRGSEPHGMFHASEIAYIRPDERFHFFEVRAFKLGGS